MTTITYNDAKRFWLRVAPAGESCWEFKGAPRNGAGYRGIKIGTRTILAHRYSWMLHRGAIPDGLHVLHTCDNRTCVNPAHLFLGTQKDNVADCLAKGRFMSMAWAKNPNAKLTADQVRQIRALRSEGTPNSVIAAQFGVHPNQVWHIVSGRQWK